MKANIATNVFALIASMVLLTDARCADVPGTTTADSDAKLALHVIRKQDVHYEHPTELACC